MGLTHTSTDAGAADAGLVIERLSPDDRVLALAGNPNVGKSTVFGRSAVWNGVSWNGW